MAVAICSRSAARADDLPDQDGIGEIWVQELDLETWKLKGERHSIWRGACGGCTILVDGVTVNSCMMLALDATSSVGRKAATITMIAAVTTRAAHGVLRLWEIREKNPGSMRSLPRA